MCAVGAAPADAMTEAPLGRVSHTHKAQTHDLLLHQNQFVAKEHSFDTTVILTQTVNVNIE